MLNGMNNITYYHVNYLKSKLSKKKMVW